MIEKELYSKIHELMPIATVDLIIIKDGKILLIKRKLDPAKGQFWFPGGRIERNESFQNAAKRLALKEVGLTIEKFEQIGVGNLTFETDPFGHGKGTHSVTFVMRANLAGNDLPKLDENHSEFTWWSGLHGNYHPFILNFGSKARLNA